MSETKSCFNCQYLTTWDYSGSREEPPDKGWDCGHPQALEFIELVEKETSGANLGEKEYAAMLGEKCPAYVFNSQNHESNLDWIP